MLLHILLSLCIWRNCIKFARQKSTVLQLLGEEEEEEGEKDIARPFLTGRFDPIAKRINEPMPASIFDNHICAHICR